MMARRLSAMVGIVLILGLALALIWRVYLHHIQGGEVEDEPALVLLSRPA